MTTRHGLSSDGQKETAMLLGKRKSENNRLYRQTFIILLFSFTGSLIMAVLLLRHTRNNSDFHCLVIGLVCYFTVYIILLYVLSSQYVSISRIIRGFLDFGASESLLGLCPFVDNKFSQVIEHVVKILRSADSLEESNREAKINALQNQINPHFLYNTLECIRSEAVLADMDEIGNMCEALAVFFRYTISNPKTMVTVNDEIMNIRTYFYIQQYRFGDRMRLKLDFQSDEATVGNCIVPKLILQPIVENAIIHGLEDKIGSGTVKIQLSICDDNLLIHVIDDGIGMDDATLHQVNQSIAHGTPFMNRKKGGIALRNVNNRIQIIYGQEYGITVNSMKQIGTDVEIVIPYRRE